MARVPDELLQCAVYLYQTREDAQQSRRSGGSGFLIGFEATAPEPLTPLSVLDPIQIPLSPPELHSDPLADRYLTYVVTAKHVVDSGSRFIRVNRRESGFDVVELASSEWLFVQGIDLAIASVDLTWAEVRALSVPLDMILTESECSQLDVGIGDDVHMVGRFINHEGVGSNQPSVRFGNISMMPGQKVAVQQPIGPQVALLIETRTVPGYSGAPVFLRVPPWEMQSAEEGTARKALSRRGVALYYLLGVSGGWIFGRNETVSIGPESKRLRGKASSNSGMMWCVPAWTLLEVLNSDAARKQRDALRAQLRRKLS